MADIASVLPRLEPLLGAADTAPPAPLAGGITNRNYRAVLGGHPYVVRLPGRGLEVLGIDRATERASAEWAGAAGVGPRVAACLDAECLVSDWLDAAPVRAGELDDAVVDGVAAALRAVHDGPPMANRFDPFRIVEQHRAFAEQHGVTLPAAYADAEATAREIAAELGPRPAPTPCHNDLLPGNVLWDGRRVWLVDWDYAAQGDPLFDLANFSVNCALSGDQRERLLARHDGVAPDGSRLRALELMGVMSEFREAMWGVVQQALSQLDFDYAAYAEARFARMRELADAL